MPVFASGYAVRFAGQQITGTSGQYYTGLTVDVTPTIDSAAAQRSLTGALVRAGIRPTEVTAGELTVLPVGEGILAYRVTATGMDVRTGEAKSLEGLVDADRGAALSAWDSLRRANGVDGSGVTLDGRTVPLKLTANPAGGYDFLDTSRPMRGDIRTYDAKRASAADLIGTLPAGTTLMNTATLPATGDATASGAVDRTGGWGRSTTTT